MWTWGGDQLRGRVGHALTPGCALPDQVLVHMSAAKRAKPPSLARLRERWVGEKKRNVECESGEEMEVLSKGQHVLLPAAFAKTAFSNSIVPHSTRLST